MLDMIVPFERRAGRLRNGEHDELISRSRQHALEFQKESQLLDASASSRMVEKRD